MKDASAGEHVGIVGGGSVGLVLGARLAAAGCQVLCLVRRPEQAARLSREGVALEDPATGETLCAPLQASADWSAAVQLRGRPVVFCTRAAQLERCAAALARHAPDAVATAAQNGIDPEAALARHFSCVLGLVVRQTCTRVDDRSARALAGGRLVLGAYASTPAGKAGALAQLLRRAGYDVGISWDLAADRWLKLCVNLMSAPNALVVREDHTSAAFVETKARLLEEARAALTAARIRAASCDGRDRSLEAEIAHQRAALARGTSPRALPLYNQVWSALRGGGSLEADAYHRRILELAHRHGLAAPTNQRVLDVLLRAAREARGPESVRAAELLPA